MTEDLLANIEITPREVKDLLARETFHTIRPCMYKSHPRKSSRPQTLTNHATSAS
jgi:hypothetical protein